MVGDWTPFLWPVTWRDPALLELLQDTPINCIVVDEGDALESVVAGARRRGLRIAGATSLPAGVTRVRGEWPGVRLTPSGRLDRVSAGPTGDPWVDSNGWRIRLTAALREGTDVWVEAPPKEPRVYPESYLIAVADAAAHGGRWVAALDEGLAAGVAGRKPEALATWRKMVAAAAFFAARKDWARYVPAAVIGVLSDFSGPNEEMGRELLNLVARTNQQYTVIPKSRVPPDALHGLKAVLCADENPPARGLRDRVLGFVRAGGLLITGKAWSLPAGARKAADGHPRYDLYAHGAGRIAVARPDFDDPYVVANDAAVLISHRHELLRFWNGGAVGSFLTKEPSGKRALVQMLFYSAAQLGKPSVRVAGRYRAGRLWTLARPTPEAVAMEIRRDAVELHLPEVGPYAAVELEA